MASGFKRKSLEQADAPALDQIFRSLSSPLLILSPTFVMVDVNEAYLAATGTTRSQLIGSDVFEVFPDNPADAKASGTANLRASLERVLKHRRPDSMGLQKYDVRLPASEGGLFQERHWLPLNTPVLDDDGEVRWIIHQVEDVTDVVKRGEAADELAAGQRTAISRLKMANDSLGKEIRDHEEAQKALVESQAWLRLLLNSSAEGVYAVDRDGSTTLCNASFLEMLGFEREEDAVGRKLHDVIHHTKPDGSSYPRTDCFIYRTAQTGEPAHVTNESFVRLDGTSFPVEYWVRPVLRNGNLEGAVCTFVDVTERALAQEGQQILLQELDHRVKNLFSIVTAIVTLSARGAASPDAMAMDIKGRVMALAQAHELIRPQIGRPEALAGLRDLVEKVVCPHVSSDRIGIRGSPVSLTTSQATGLALVLHELSTNAVKYGSLSTPKGRVEISWSTGNGKLTIEWAESGGPEIGAPPTGRGFGTLLAERTAKATLRGSIGHDWRPGGLLVQLTMPLENEPPA